MQQSLENEYIQHPRVAEEALESRTYQEVIAASATTENTLVVLPTGLGKTAIGILLAAHRLEEQPTGKILMLAPTRPLVEQHCSEFRRCLETDTGIFEILTGETRPQKRAELWKEVGCFFATPQVVENDIINGRLPLEDFSLLIFDEVHRATGEYPYTFVAEQYQQVPDGLVLGLTASPGSSREQIEQVAANLGIDTFEIRTEDDPDVQPYVQRKETHWVEVELDQHFERVKRALTAAEHTFLNKLKQHGFLDSTSNVSKKQLLRLRGELGSRVKEEDDPALYQGLSHVAACMKVEHTLELLETQGITPLYRFLEKMKKDPGSKAAKRLLDDDDFQNAVAVTEWMYRNGKEHPKLERLQELVQQKLTGDETAIVFTQYRDTVDLIHDRLDDALQPVKFKGQSDGFTQQKQLEILDEFRDGTYNVLVSTSVGEEGLDIPAVDYVFFYEPIPSEIRTIQRRGRTGRQESGDIYVLLAKGTRDEAYYWSAKHKEDEMKTVMNELKEDGMEHDPEQTKQTAAGQASLTGFSNDEQVQIYADDRENQVMKELARNDIAVQGTRLQIGDFIVSNRTVVERKTAEDFVSSIIDNRLFPQLTAMTDEFSRPVLIIEGQDLYRHRDIHPNAVRGALSSIVLEYQIPILWSTGVEDTADTLIALARREQEEQDRGITIRGEQTPKTERELQEFIVAGLPNVSEKLAKRLLKQFGTVEAVFNASETKLQQVDGIGDQKAKRIKDILEKDYDRGG